MTIDDDDATTKNGFQRKQKCKQNNQVCVIAGAWYQSKHMQETIFLKSMIFRVYHTMITMIA